jgi:hypothetical protein
MKHYKTQLATEAIVVGLSTIGAFYIVRSAIPDASIITQLFVSGAGLHLTYEGLGLNKWYLKNGAASYCNKCPHSKEKESE